MQPIAVAAKQQYASFLKLVPPNIQSRRADSGGGSAAARGVWALHLPDRGLN
jgi:hypothetical protein